MAVSQVWRIQRPNSNKIHAYNSTALSVNAPVRHGASEIHTMSNVTDIETVSGTTVSIHADDKASLYQSLPNGPRTIRTELFAGDRLLERRLDPSRVGAGRRRGPFHDAYRSDGGGDACRHAPSPKSKKTKKTKRKKRAKCNI